MLQHWVKILSQDRLWTANCRAEIQIGILRCTTHILSVDVRYQNDKAVKIHRRVVCMDGTHLVTQCAAVRTHCVPMRAPPQRYWFSELMSATCQHHSAGSPSSPPTTRPCLSRLRAVPFTPHTHLLYTGGRGVVELPSRGPRIKTSTTFPQTALFLYANCVKLHHHAFHSPVQSRA